MSKKDYRIIGVILGLELFGHERGNIEAFEALRASGARLLIGVGDRPDNHVAAELQRRGFETFGLPFGPQWSKQWIRKEPSLAIRQVGKVFRCSRRFVSVAKSFRATHVQLGSYLAYSYVSLALKQLSLPMIYRMGDAPPVDSPFNYRVWWRPAMARATAVVANSRFIADAAIEAGVAPEKVRVLYNHPPGRQEARGGMQQARQVAESEPATLLYVGSIAEHKGLIPLVDALSLLRDRGLDIRLHLAGGSRWEGDFRTVLEDRIKALGLRERVVWHGFVDDPDALYRMADLLVAPSLCEEASPNTVVEAKRLGLAAVAFPSGGLPELVRDGIDGYICEDKTADSLASAIQWMLEDRDRLTAMGQEARKDYEARFGWERFKEEWADVYASLGSG